MFANTFDGGVGTIYGTRLRDQYICKLNSGKVSKRFEGEVLYLQSHSPQEYYLTWSICPKKQKILHDLDVITGTGAYVPPGCLCTK